MSLVIDVGDRPGPGRDRGVTAAAAAIRRGELVVLPARPAIGKSPLAAIWRRDRPSTLQARAFTEQVEHAIQADNIALAA